MKLWINKIIRTDKHNEVMVTLRMTPVVVTPVVVTPVVVTPVVEIPSILIPPVDIPAVVIPAVATQTVGTTYCESWSKINQLEMHQLEDLLWEVLYSTARVSTVCLTLNYGPQLYSYTNLHIIGFCNINFRLWKSRQNI